MGLALSLGAYAHPCVGVFCLCLRCQLGLGDQLPFPNSQAVFDGKPLSATAADNRSFKYALHTIVPPIDTGDCFRYGEDDDDDYPEGQVRLLNMQQDSHSFLYYLHHDSELCTWTHRLSVS